MNKKATIKKYIVLFVFVFIFTPVPISSYAHLAVKLATTTFIFIILAWSLHSKEKISFNNKTIKINQLFKDKQLDPNDIHIIDGFIPWTVFQGNYFSLSTNQNNQPIFALKFIDRQGKIHKSYSIRENDLEINRHELQELKDANPNIQFSAELTKFIETGAIPNIPYNKVARTIFKYAIIVSLSAMLMGIFYFYIHFSSR